MRRLIQSLDRFHQAVSPSSAENDLQVSATFPKEAIIHQFCQQKQSNQKYNLGVFYTFETLSSSPSIWFRLSSSRPSQGGQT
jgi:hypothetical protein